MAVAAVMEFTTLRGYGIMARPSKRCFENRSQIATKSIKNLKRAPKASRRRHKKDSGPHMTKSNGETLLSETREVNCQGLFEILGREREREIVS